MLATALVSLAFPQTQAVPQTARERYSLLRVAPEELAAQPAALRELGIDHVAFDGESGSLEFAASERERAALDAAGIELEIVIEDLASYYAARLTPAPEGTTQFGAWLSPSFSSGSMGGYYTYAEVGSVLDQLHAAYPALTSAKQSIGTSLEGRALWMIKLSDNPGVDENEPELRIDALHHAREPEGMQASLWFVLWLLESYATDPLARYLIDERELYYVPVVNPDGYVYNQTTNPGGGGMWRKNRRNNGGGSFGVDLNRNYSDHWGWDNTGSSPTASSETYRGTGPASEPEVAALEGFFGARSFATSLSIHTYGNLWLYPYGYAQLYPTNNAQYVEVSNLATALNHYLVGPPSYTLYLVNGGIFDHEHNAHGTLGWSPEIGSSSDGFWPPTSRIVPLAEENLVALQRTALAAGAWARVESLTLDDAGDGDGFFEPGESLEIAVAIRNSGRATTATSVLVALSTSSPYASVVAGSHALGTLASFSSTTSPPLTLAIAANAPGGATIAVDVTCSYEGWSQVETRTFVVGEPIRFVFDDAESDRGWTMTLATDSATSGRWTRGTPLGTSSSGQPANPSNDTTPAPGVACFVTGNAGGSAGTDDVDGGTTTLISPVFDLSSCGPARLSYSRWFADLTVADDVFAVSISNNGGSTWLPLETLAGNANSWQVSSHEVTNVLPQTAQMRLRFVASDAPNNSIVEAAIDDLEVTIFDSTPKLNLYGRPSAGATVLANLTGPAGASFVLRATLSDPSAPPPSSTQRARVIATGVIPASRHAQVAVQVPAGAAWVGQTIYYRAITLQGSAKQPSNWASIVVQ